MSHQESPHDEEHALVNDRTPASPAALLEGSQLMRQGTADVFRHRERSRLKKVLRAITVVFLLDAFLYDWYTTGHRIGLPSFGPEFIYFLPVIGIFVAIAFMALMPFMFGRSPHLTVYPEQVEIGLTDIKGLDTQVDEVIRTLDVFLGYATFRDELGGTPRRGILFEGPPGTGKTFLAKAMAKQAGVPFMFIPAPSFVSMWQGMTAWRIRAFFKKLRKAARKEGGAIGFIEEIDAVAMSRGGVSSATEAPSDLARTTSAFFGSGEGSMVNELLIQLQSFDTPPWRDRVRGKLIAWVNGYLPPNRQFHSIRPEYHNILLIAATNRGDSLDPALLRPGRFDRRLYFDLPTKQERRDLIDFFLARKSHHEQLDDDADRERIAHETFGYTPVMIEHLFDEALLVSLREGRKRMNFEDVMEAKFTEEIGTKQVTNWRSASRERRPSSRPGSRSRSGVSPQRRCASVSRGRARAPTSRRQRRSRRRWWAPSGWRDPSSVTRPSPTDPCLARTSWARCSRTPRRSSGWRTSWTASASAFARCSPRTATSTERSATP
ncbi:MAG: AAA family ATPase [Actinobacteria bacterium]|nr:MAG: AAA family ATPase [Actinomycetota bacterium]